MSIDYIDDTDAAAKVGEPTQAPRDAVRESRAMVAVERGVRPASLAEQVTFAQAMSLGTGVPPHLRNNVGGCLAIVDIAQRTSLSPFLLAGHCYVESDRLSFDAQAVQSIIENSGYLETHFRHRYEGEGDNLRCIVWATLRGERQPHEHIGGTLKELHPGVSEKINPKTGRPFVRGSQLWDTKPRVQLYYNTVRDWVRMHCPAALMGALAREEMIESGIGAADNAKVVSVLSRLPGAQNGDGFNHDNVRSELDQIAGVGGKVIDQTDDEPPAPEKEKAKPPRGKSTTLKAEPPKTEKEKAKPAPQPTTAKEYKAYAEGWIGRETDKDNALARWDGERDIRDTLSVKIPDRKALEKLITEKFGE